MHSTAKGIAHVSFPGGGVFLPARSASDRHRLITYVDRHLRASSRVQVLIGAQRWVAYSVAGVRCDRCDGAVERALLCAAQGAPYCTSCALRADAD